MEPVLELCGPPGGGKSTWLDCFRSGETPPEPASRGRVRYLATLGRHRREVAGFLGEIRSSGAPDRLRNLRLFLQALDRSERRMERAVWESRSYRVLDEGLFQKLLAIYSYEDRDVPWARVLARTLRSWRPAVVVACVASEDELLRRLGRRGRLAPKFEVLPDAERRRLLTRFLGNIERLEGALRAAGAPTELSIQSSRQAEDGTVTWSVRRL